MPGGGVRGSWGDGILSCLVGSIALWGCLVTDGGELILVPFSLGTHGYSLGVLV